MPSLRNKTVLITGASSGLGRGLATALSHAGNRLVVTARRQGLLDELAAEVVANGSECIVAAADATDPTACRAVIDSAVEAFGSIDVAILNAGGGVPLTMDVAELDSVLQVMRANFDTFANFLVPMIAHMKGAGGTIAYTGSPAGYFGLPKSGPYSAAKAAGRVLFDACRIELKGSDIELVALYPGFTSTPGLDPDDVPFQWLIIDVDRAVGEMLWAIERGKAHHMFPKRIRYLMMLARLMPEPIRRWLLQRAS